MRARAGVRVLACACWRERACVHSAHPYPAEFERSRDGELAGDINGVGDVKEERSLECPGESAIADEQDEARDDRQPACNTTIHRQRDVTAPPRRRGVTRHDTTPSTWRHGTTVTIRSQHHRQHDVTTTPSPWRHDNTATMTSWQHNVTTTLHRYNGCSSLISFARGRRWITRRGALSILMIVRYLTSLRWLQTCTLWLQMRLHCHMTTPPPPPHPPTTPPNLNPSYATGANLRQPSARNTSRNAGRLRHLRTVLSWRWPVAACGAVRRSQSSCSPRATAAPPRGQRWHRSWSWREST